MDERGGEKFRFYGGRKRGKRQNEEEEILTIKQTWLLLNSPQPKGSTISICNPKK